MALGGYGRALRSLSCVEDALAAFGEGIELLNPLMAQFGATFGSLYSAFVDDLIETLDSAGRAAEAETMRRQFHRQHN